MLSEQIIEIADKLLPYQWITPSQHQNMRNAFGMQSTFGIFSVKSLLN